MYVIRTRVTDKRKSEHYWGVQCAMQCMYIELHMPPRIPKGPFTNYVCIFWNFLTTYAPSLHVLCKVPIL